jgi:hypothetical protein
MSGQFDDIQIPLEQENQVPIGLPDNSKNVIALPHSPVFGIDETSIINRIQGISNVLVQYLVLQPRD